MARKLIVDGKEIEADDNITLLQACELAGAEIPALLLSRTAERGRQLPHVPGGMGGRAQSRKPPAPCRSRIFFPNKDGTPGQDQHHQPLRPARRAKA